VLNQLSTTPWRRMGSGCVAPAILTSALDGGEWSASRPSRFTPGETAAGNHWIGGWVGPRACLTQWSKENFFAPTIQHVACHYTDELPQLLFYHCYFVLFLWRTYYLRTDSLRVKYIGYNFKVLHLGHVCNYILISYISYIEFRYVHERSPYKISDA
jgi:hypothetical protein